MIPIIPRITPKAMSNRPIISISQAMRPDLKIAPRSTRKIAVTIRPPPPSLFNANSGRNRLKNTEHDKTILCAGDIVKKRSINSAEWYLQRITDLARALHYSATVAASIPPL
jgi:hypothetical protein